jgi:hypothetical protein
MRLAPLIALSGSCLLGFAAAASAQVASSRVQPDSARVQADSAFDALTTPVSPMMCRAVALTEADSAALAFGFVDARGPIERRTVAAFDSTGSPLYATVTTTFVAGPPGGGWAELMGMRFTPTTWGTRARREFAPSALQSDSPAVAGIPVVLLLAEQLSRGRTLAEWIWAHRCADSKK